jgi:hypothetical protein
MEQSMVRAGMQLLQQALTCTGMGTCGRLMGSRNMSGKTSHGVSHVHMMFKELEQLRTWYALAC